MDEALSTHHLPRWYTLADTPHLLRPALSTHHLPRWYT